MGRRGPQSWTTAASALGVAAVALAFFAGCQRGSGTTSAESGDAPASTATQEQAPKRSACNCERPPSFSKAVQRVRPAVVNLYSAHGGPDAGTSAGGPRQPGRGGRTSLGSGVILDDEGYVVTNHHVTEGVEDVRARLLDGRWFETRRVGSDARTDLALLQLVEADDVPTAPLGDSSSLDVGDWVIAIGNPVGLNSTVTVGVTSGIGRSNLQLSKELRYQDFIQTDASINPGNSGGPLVDARGRVVGINTVVSARAQGIGFAIPSAMLEKELPWLKKGGDVARSWLGLYVDKVPGPLRDQIDVGAKGGALITGIVEGGPAEEANLQKGDVLLQLGGTQVDGLDHLTWMAGRLEVGEPVDVVVQRGSKRRRFELTPTPPPDSGKRDASPR